MEYLPTETEIVRSQDYELVRITNISLDHSGRSDLNLDAIVSQIIGYSDYIAMRWGYLKELLIFD